LAEFITKLATTPEGEGTILDNTIVLYGSSNSQTHVNTNYPMMLVGGEKLGLKQGVQLMSSDEFEGFYFNNVTTMKKKVALAKELKINGIMIWEIELDDKDMSLLTTLKNELD
jgi:hypothetical protein